MTNEERKDTIKQLLAGGRSLSEILDYLQKEKGDQITYLELRLLLAEMPNVELPEKAYVKAESQHTDLVTEPKRGPVAASEASSPNISLSLDQVPQPGSVLSGFARFRSGAKACWLVDGYGRLGMEPELGSSKPTPEDMREFSTELKRLVDQGGGGM